MPLSSSGLAIVVASDISLFETLSTAHLKLDELARMTRIAAQYLATIAFMMFNSSQQQPELARELELLKQKLPDDQKAFWMPLIEKVDGEMKACIVCIGTGCVQLPTLEV